MTAEIWEILGRATAFVLAAGSAAYGLFVFVGKKWIERKFAEQQADFEHAKNRELEGLRYEINSFFDRKTKMHAKEFDIIPTLWALLNDAVNALGRIVSIFQSYPDIARMNDQRLSEFLASSRLSDADKDDLVNATDRNKYYQRQIVFYEIRDVRNSYVKFRDYYKKNSIFLPTELNDRFQKIDDLLWDALLDRQHSQEFDDTKKWVESSRTMRNKVTPVLDEIEKLIHAEIHKDIEIS